MSSLKNMGPDSSSLKERIQPSQTKQQQSTHGPTTGNNKVASTEKPRVPMTTLPTTKPTSSGCDLLHSMPPKSHKIEGKNKKSLHHKQQQANDNQQRAKEQSRLANEKQPTTSSSSSIAPERRIHGKNTLSVNPKQVISTSGGPSISSTVEKPVANCVTIDDFSREASELKADINRALEKQSEHPSIDQPVEVVRLKEDILKLSGLEKDEKTSYSSGISSLLEPKLEQDHRELLNKKHLNENVRTSSATESDTIEAKPSIHLVRECQDQGLKSPNHDHTKGANIEPVQKVTPPDLESSHNNSLNSSEIKSCGVENDAKVCNSDSILTKALDNLMLNQDDKTSQSSKDDSKHSIKLSAKKRPQNHLTEIDSGKKSQPSSKSSDIMLEEFEPLNAKLDLDTKVVTMVSSLQKHFNEAPHLLEPVCRRLVNMSEENTRLTMNCERYQAENQKLSLVKQKLENLCRELQKSNNAIRIESLELIKAEQGKAKEQSTKIQSTLSGVIKLFDENQQRNMILRQENHDLQTKLKSLLDHYDNWEKSVETALRQRDIEVRLVKTELAKANLLKNEEKEKFLGEKQELLQILSMMQEQQHRIEGQEAKLRSDLSSYANKYDECQAVINKGMNKFQVETKRMLKQIEKSKQDYKVLLSKYESSNKRMAQLLEEKQYWDKTINLANKKIETLEKLCRALRDRKAEGKNIEGLQRVINKNNSTSQSKDKLKKSDERTLMPCEGGPIDVGVKKEKNLDKEEIDSTMTCALNKSKLEEVLASNSISDPKNNDVDQNQDKLIEISSANLDEQTSFELEPKQDVEESMERTT